MKRTGFLLAALFALALVSCKKEFTCTCKTYLNGVEVTTTNVTIEKARADAKDECDEGDVPETTVLGFTSSQECEIK